MKITFKIAGGKTHDLECSGSETVEELRKTLEEPLGIADGKCKFIYKGSILKDTDTASRFVVKSVNKEGAEEPQTVHVVKVSGGYTPAAAAAPSAAPAAAPQAASAPAGMPDMSAMFGGQNPFAAGGMGGLNMAQMLENPMMQQVMQQMTSNPAMLQQVIQNNPMLQQLAGSNPALRDALSNPATLSEMMSPDNLRAASRAFGSGGAGGPDLSALLGLGGAGAAAPAGNAGQSAGSPNDIASFLSGGAGGMDPMAMLNNPNFMNQVNSVLSSLNAGGANMPAAAGGATGSQDFTEQVKRLEDMGFTDATENREALTRANGNVDAAIEFLLEKNN